MFVDLNENLDLLVAGVDEAGRGPLAGPVVVAAVIMPRDNLIEGVTDSKKLPAKKREEFYALITERAIGFSISEIDNKTIDQVNILEATKLGVYECIKKISPAPEFVYIDGNMRFKLDIPYKSVVSGDSLVYNCACASILAKVHRDRIMSSLPEQYELYKFEKHKGYPTELHYEMLRKYGSSDLHRQSFLKQK